MTANETDTIPGPPVRCAVHGVTFIGEDQKCHHGTSGPGDCPFELVPNVVPLTEGAYELIRGPLFDGPPGQGAEAAKRKIAEAIAARPLDLMLWLTDAGIVEHVMFHAPGTDVTISRLDAPDLCTVAAHRDGE